MPVTIKQIAETSGFSVPTVSQILNNKGHLYRPETRDRVFEVARDLGYRPNSFRWALRTGRFNNLGLLVPAPVLGVPAAVSDWAALADALAGRDMHLTVGSVTGPMDPENPARTPKMLREWSVDGLLLACGWAFPEDLRKLIEDHKIPAIDVGTRRGRDCVFGDEQAAVADAVAELAKLGHKRIGYVETAGPQAPGAEDRLSGFKAGASAGKLQTTVVHPAEPLSPADRHAACVELLRAGKRPTAVIAGGIDDALTLLHAAAAQGLAVPGDLSVLAIAHRAVDAAGLTVDRLGVDEAVLLQQAAEMLLRRVDQPGKSVPAKKLPLARHAGQTVTKA